jgi:hypothetical protein
MIFKWELHKCDFGMEVGHYTLQNVSHLLSKITIGTPGCYLYDLEYLSLSSGMREGCWGG